MQYKCEVCHDSGSKNQAGDYLDCPACDMPHTRKALNDFVKSLGPTHPEDVALAIHQRALAMAPKQEAPKGDAQKNPKANTWPAEIYLQAGDTDVEAHLSYDAAIRHEVTWAAESIDWNDVRYIRADLAAPAAANGALTDEQVHQGVMALLGCTSSEVEDYSAKLYEGYANDVRRVHAALSGAKGN